LQQRSIAVRSRPVTSSLRFLLVLASVALAAACSSSDDAQTHGSNGVDDVAKACAIRASWTQGQSAVCNTCLAEATAPRCACSDKDFAGKCSTQKDALDTEPTCDGVSTCRLECQPTDCACIDACYAGKEICRARASAVDGCTAEACAEICQ
jgi:hypothetical protein